MTIEQERDEALSFARSEVKRNADLSYEISLLRNKDSRNYEAVAHIRELMKAQGFSGGSYLGVQDGKNRIGDEKYLPSIEILEAFFNHLISKKDQ